MNLAALHGQLGETDRQLALVESLLDDNRLQRGHYLLNMANLFLAHQLPYKAARLLETEIASGRIEESQKNLELQSQAWYLAGEEARAIPPLEAAAELSEDGEIYLRVARLYMDLYNWRARRQFVKAAESEDSARWARQWLKFIDSEERRIAALQ
jgi:tetratricopeptide (TPR) repeat protein